MVVVAAVAVSVVEAAVVPAVSMVGCVTAGHRSGGATLSGNRCSHANLERSLALPKVKHLKREREREIGRSYALDSLKHYNIGKY